MDQEARNSAEAFTCINHLAKFLASIFRNSVPELSDLVLTIGTPRGSAS